MVLLVVVVAGPCVVADERSLHTTAAATAGPAAPGVQRATLGAAVLVVAALAVAPARTSVRRCRRSCAGAGRCDGSGVGAGVVSGDDVGVGGRSGGNAILRLSRAGGKDGHRCGAPTTTSSTFSPLPQRLNRGNAAVACQRDPTTSDSHNSKRAGASVGSGCSGVGEALLLFALLLKL